MAWWIDFVRAFNSPAGNLVACLILVLFLTPFLWQNNTKAWEALTFILGVIGGLVRGSTHPEANNANPATNPPFKPVEDPKE